MLEKNIRKYLKKNPITHHLEPEFKVMFQNSIIIPVLAELEFIDKTLTSIAKNPIQALQQTLVILVINNPETTSITQEKVDENQRLLNHLRSKQWSYANLNLAWIDASTAGCEIRKNPCVGTARKLGMDLALRYIDPNNDPLLICLDADTIVEENYITSIRKTYEQNKTILGAVINYQHSQSDDPTINDAITDYELYMRQYEMGLSFSGSPYAYHTIGSTITCRVEGYVKAGGMKTKNAGEDFYFLQDLRKTGGIAFIDSTTVHPSPRISDRVPFGTGPKIKEISNGHPLQFHNPELFINLKQNLDIINNLSCQQFASLADLQQFNLSHEFSTFLDDNNFLNNWQKIVQNTPKKTSYLNNAFHTWFDAFRTLKFIHFCEERYPEKFQKVGYQNAFAFNTRLCNKNFSTKKELLTHLRESKLD